MNKPILMFLGIVAILVVIYAIYILTDLKGNPPDTIRIETQRLEQEMLNEFIETSHVVLASIPHDREFSPGTEVHFKIGVRKPAAADDYEYFSLCIGTLLNSTCESKTVLSSIAVDQSGIEFIFPSVARIVERGKIERLSSIMRIPKDTIPGIYGFNIYVCPVDDITQLCEPGESIGMYSFIIQVKT